MAQIIEGKIEYVAVDLLGHKHPIEVSIEISTEKDQSEKIMLLREMIHKRVKITVEYLD